MSTTTTTKLTKIDKFNKIIDLLLSLGEEVDVDDSIAFLNKEIELVENKRANDKMRKDKAKKDDYEPLIDEAVKVFLLKDDGIIGNDDLNKGAFDGMSVSKKTQIFNKLIDMGKVERVAKKKTKEKQLYKWVIKTAQAQEQPSTVAQSDIMDIAQ